MQQTRASTPSYKTLAIAYVLGRIYRTQGKASLANREYQIFEENEANERHKQRERLRQALGGKRADEQ